ncbi:MAG: ATP-binding cassette domain-containing protein [Methanomicrobiales archaeon]
MTGTVTIHRLSHRVLSIPQLSIGPGRVALIGPNGSGKTTLLRLIAGVVLPSWGTVSAPADVGWVGEFPHRNAVFSRVEDEIASPLRFRHHPCPDIRRRVEAMATDLGIAPLLSRSIRTLSAGERVMVALATALISRPALLLLDEYDSHLDPGTAGRVEESIDRLLPPTVVFTTQRMWSAARADRVIYLEGGEVLVTGTPSAVFSRLQEISPEYVPPGWGWTG